MIVLAAGAHPADVFDLAGGTLANFSRTGHTVYVVVLTHGAYSHSQVVSSKDHKVAVEEVIALKRSECDAAAAAVGAKDARYLGYTDEPFVPSRKSVLELAECVRELRPDVVITHHPREYGHPDHPVAGDVVLRALKASERWLEGSERPPHRMPRAYFFGTQFRGVCAKLGSEVAPPDFVVDITGSIEAKKKAIAAFRSQSYRQNEYDEAWVEDRLQKIEGYWGIMNGFKYAEEFISMTPHTGELLPQ